MSVFLKKINIFKLNPVSGTIKMDLTERLPIFKKIAPGQFSSFGWVSPEPNSDELCFENNGFFMLKAKIEEKLLPAKVINQELAKRVAAKEGVHISSAELTDLKEQVTHELLAKAFSVENEFNVFIQNGSGWVFIDAAPAKAEIIFSELKRGLSYQFQAFTILKETKINLEIEMTRLLKYIFLRRFDLGGKCKLSGEDKSTVTHSNQDLTSEEVKDGFVKYGKNVKELSLIHDNSLSFVLNNKFEIKSCKWLNKPEKSDMTGDVREQFHADFFIVTNTLRRLVIDLINLLQEDRE